MKNLKLLKFIVLATVLVALTTQSAYSAPMCSEIFARPLAQPQSESKWQNVYRKLLFTAALTAGTLAPYAALAGGFSGSGGGGGIAVFREPSDAARARDQRGQFGEILTDNLSNAKVITLEHWDMLKAGKATFDVKPDDNWQTLVARAKENLRHVSPVLAMKLDEISTRMDLRGWVPVGDLPKVDDVYFFDHVPKDNEVHVQIAVRLSHGNNERDDGPPSRIPRLKVLVNKRLFDQMAPIDQAILVLHEELYALGQSVGLHDSDEIRKFVGEFFSKDLDQKRLEGRRIETSNDFAMQWLKRKLELYFRDYGLFFADPNSMAKGEPRSAQRLLSILAEISKEMHAQMAAKAPARTAPADPNEYYFPTEPIPRNIIEEYAARKDLSPEKAFVYITHFFLDRNSQLVNSEWIMDTKASEAEHRDQLDKMCKVVLETALKMPKETLRTVPSLKQAAQYCR